MTQGRKPRSLLPREHGVYAEVAFPLLAALLLGAWSWPSALLASAIVAAFLMHEPVLVLMGRRGKNLKARMQARAAWRLKILAGTAVGAGLTGLWLAPPEARWALAALFPPLGVVLALLARGREKSLLGESLVAVIFSFAPVAVGLAGGLPFAVAIGSSAVWAIGFVLGTAAVHAIFARKMKKTERPSQLTTLAAVSVSVGAVVWTATGGPMVAASVLPCTLLVAGLGLTNLHPRSLKAVGLALVAADFVTLGLLLRWAPLV